MISVAKISFHFDVYEGFYLEFLQLRHGWRIHRIKSLTVCVASVLRASFIASRGQLGIVVLQVMGEQRKKNKKKRKTGRSLVWSFMIMFQKKVT